MFEGVEAWLGNGTDWRRTKAAINVNRSKDPGSEVRDAEDI